MFSYVIVLAAFLLVLYNPIVELLTPSGVRVHPQIQRTPRPKVLDGDLLALEDANRTARACVEPESYKIHVFSREPLVIYIENFLALDEMKHLLEISEPILEPSTVTHDGGASGSHRDTAIRDSEVALIPRTETVRCIEDRARSLQGWRDDVWIERLRVQRYRGPAGHYSHHFDWSSNHGGWGRVSSFMVWVDDGSTSSSSSTTAGGSELEDSESLLLEGGGTEFPRLKRRGDRRWCAFVECPSSAMGDDGEDEGGVGVVFKPLPGNAVYWENFRSDGTGRGYEEAWHAGLPVTKGVKVGLNIWSSGRID